MNFLVGAKVVKAVQYPREQGLTAGLLPDNDWRSLHSSFDGLHRIKGKQMLGSCGNYPRNTGTCSRTLL